PNNASQPARKSRWLGQCRQSGPCGDEGFLNDILGLLEIAHFRERRSESEMLEAPRQIDKGLDVAFARPANQLIMIHRRTLSPQGARKGSVPLKRGEINSRGVLGLVGVASRQIPGNPRTFLDIAADRDRGRRG